MISEFWSASASPPALARYNLGLQGFSGGHKHIPPYFLGAERNDSARFSSSFTPNPVWSGNEVQLYRILMFWHYGAFLVPKMGFLDFLSIFSN